MKKEDIITEIENEKQRLSAFIQKSCKARIKLVKQNKYQQAIATEIAVSLSNQRLDLVENLITRLNRIEELHKALENIEYAETFGKDTNSTLN